jgi:hypothetical protein
MDLAYPAMALGNYWAEFRALPWWQELIVLGVVAGLVWGWVRSAKSSLSQRQIRGPALTGTARALSVKEGHQDIESGFWRKAPAGIWCKIGLRVEVPGREPYDVTVRRWFVSSATPAEGDAWVVQVAVANPRRVRVDFDQPIT